MPKFLCVVVVMALAVAPVYSQSCVRDTKDAFIAACQQAGGEPEEHESAWNPEGVLFSQIKWGSGQKPGTDACGYTPITEGSLIWDDEYSHALVCRGETPVDPPDDPEPPTEPPSDPPSDPPVTPQDPECPADCTELISLSLEPDCTGTDELVVFNPYGGQEFTVYVCVDGEPFEERVFSVPYFSGAEGVWEVNRTFTTGYCPSRATVRLNPLPPVECRPWFTNNTALWMFVLDR